MKRWSWLALVSLALGAACTPSAQSPVDSSRPPPAKAIADSPDPVIRLQSIELGLPERMERDHIPAVSIAIIDHYEIASAKAWGVLDTEQRGPVTTDSLFHASSISMVLNAMATLKLVEDGRLSLDADVNERLTSWKVPPNTLTTLERPTIRRILNHTAGFNVNGFGRGYAVNGRMPTLSQVLNGELPAINEPIRIVYTPGSKMEFSAGGVTVLQQLLVDVTEAKYDELLRDTVLIPLGMTMSSFEQPTAADAIDFATSGHDKNGEVVNGWQRGYPTQAASGLWSTPSDLARLVIEIEKSAMGTSNKILTQKTVQELMLRPSDPALGGMGLGLFLTKKGGHTVFYHRGTHIGFSGYLVGYPELGIGAVILTNGELGNKLFEELLDRIAVAYHWPT